MTLSNLPKLFPTYAGHQRLVSCVCLEPNRVIHFHFQECALGLLQHHTAGGMILCDVRCPTIYVLLFLVNEKVALAYGRREYTIVEKIEVESKRQHITVEGERYCPNLLGRQQSCSDTEINRNMLI